MNPLDSRTKLFDATNQAELRGQQVAMRLFNEMAQRVPAYKDFLRRENIDPNKIHTIDDFRQITPVDKSNYLTKYSIKDLSWDGNLFNSRMISVSSGSTGEPFFWPRGKSQDEEGGIMHEKLYREIFDIDKQTTLIVVCFSMGTWIAGSFTTSSSLLVADKGYKINIVTPGIEKEEALKVIRKLGPQYDQVILTGYPPFLKDIVDEGIKEGVDWKKMKIRFLFAGESYSEEWRDYVLERVGTDDFLRGSANIYGTADAAMIGHETPVSVLLRKIYTSKTSLVEKTFGTRELPSIMQYDPQLRYVEGVNGEIVFSALAGIPLLRYNIHDTGGVKSFDELVDPVRDDFDEGVRSHDVNITPWQLPFVFLSGRKDFTVTIYAVNIYPENIKAALITPELRQWFTGKFTMATKYYSDMDQYFEVNLELSKGVDAKPEIEHKAREQIIAKLKSLNAEFNRLYAAIEVKAEPKVHLISHGDSQYFGKGVKHKWVKK